MMNHISDINKLSKDSNYYMRLGYVYDSVVKSSVIYLCTTCFPFSPYAYLFANNIIYIYKCTHLYISICE